MSTHTAATPPRPKFIDANTITEQVSDIGRLEQRRADDKADPFADAQLEGVYRAEGAWPELIALLLDRVEEVDESEAVATLLLEVAGVYRDQLGDAEAARLVLVEAFPHDPSNRQLVDALDAAAHATGAWDEVLDAYLVAAAKLGNHEPRVASDLWLRIACASIVRGDWEPVAEALDHVRDLDTAAMAPYLDMVEQAASTAEVLETLSQVCARVGDLQRMSRVLSRAIACTPTPEARGRLHRRIADLQRELGDEDAAMWHWNEAVRLDPEQSDATEHLIAAYKQRGDRRGLARFLEDRRAKETDPAERARLAFEAASVYADDLDEHTHAIGLYAASFAGDPGQTAAAVPLAERYYNQERWHELAPVIETLADAGAHELTRQGLSPAETYFRAGRCAFELGDFRTARARYGLALDVAPDHLPSLLGAAEACRRSGDLRGAYERLSAALPAIEATESDARVAEVMCDMATLLRDGGNRRGAQDLYERAIHLSATHDALEGAAALYAEAGDHAAVLELKRQCLAFVDDPAKVRLLSEMAYISAHKLGAPYEAIDLYQQALDLDANDREVLHHLVELQSAAEQWHDAVDTIIQIAHVEKDAYRRGKYYQAAGTIARHHIGRTEAIGYLNRALDYFFVEIEHLPPKVRARCLEAFTDIGTMLYEDRAWTELERNYRRMIQRMNPESPEAAELWHGLGQLYRKHLGRRDSAIDSFEVAAALDEDRATNHHILLDLYDQASPEHLRKSAIRRQQLLAGEPYNPDHYRALMHLYHKQNLVDEAWSCSRALAFLGQADEHELAFFRGGMRPAHVVPPRALTDAMWEGLRHPDEDKSLTTLMGLVSAAVSHRFASAPRKLGLGKPLPATDPVCDLFNRVNAALGNVPVDAYFMANLHTEIAVATVKRGGQALPAFAMGPRLTAGRSSSEVLTRLAEAAAYARPAYFVRRSLPTGGELEAAFLATLRHTGVEAPVSPMHATAVAAYESLLRKRLPAPWFPLVAEAVRAFLHQGKSSNLGRWARAADATCRRASLLVSDDLYGVCTGVQRTMSGDTDDHRDAAVRDILVFSVSAVHSQMRRALGVALQ